jgi:hypothetical protein
VQDPVLDSMMAQAAATFDAAQRARIYANIARYNTSQGIRAVPRRHGTGAVTAKAVYGPGLDQRYSSASRADLALLGPEVDREKVTPGNNETQCL